MLTPAGHHSLVPRPWAENLKYRDEALAACGESADARAALMQACSDDCLLWINLFAWQFNPKKKGRLSIGPFTTFAFQDKAITEILWCIDHDEDLVIEKSRELGASWFCLLVAVWLFLFRPWQKTLFVSKHENAVIDRKDTDSLFWKVSFILGHLPGWMLPAGFPAGYGLAARNPCVTKRGYVNPANHSSISSSASTEDAGVGGRAGLMFIDEFSLIGGDFALLQGTASTASCRIFNGTHRGLHTAFFKMLYDEVSTFRRVRMHWTEHPEKAAGLYRFDPVTRKVEVLDKDYDYPPDFEFVRAALPAGGAAPCVRSPWYDRECRRLLSDTRRIAEEQDIDPRGSTKQFFDGLVISDLTREYGREPAWVGDVKYDAETGAFLGVVASPGGPLRLWFDPTRTGGVPPKEEAGLLLQYAAGGDISRGTGATPSCLSFGNTLGEKVGEYVNPRIGPIQLAPVAFALCSWFSDLNGVPAAFAWEIPGPGIEFGEELAGRLKYRNVYFRKVNERGIYKERDTDKPGWHNRGKDSADPLLTEYRDAVQLRWLRNPSKFALDECRSFEYTPNGIKHSGELSKDDPSGARENHGDIVFADALMWMMLKDRVRARPRAAEAEDPRPVGSLAWRQMLARHQDVQRDNWIYARR